MLPKKTATFACIVMLLFTLNCRSKLVVTKLNTSNAKGSPADYETLEKDKSKRLLEERIDRKGVFYSLPRTLVKADVKILRETTKPGKYAIFASLFFPNEAKYVLKSEEKFSIDEVKFASRAVADPEQVFMVKITGHPLQDKFLLLDFTEDGVAAKAESEVDNKTGELIANTAKSFAPIVAPILFAATGTPAPIVANRATARMGRTFSINIDELPDWPTIGDDSEFIATLSPEDKIVYQSLTDPLDKKFYRALTEEEREGFRDELSSDDQKDYYNKLSRVDQFAFYAMGRTRRDFLISLERAKKRFHLNSEEQQRFYIRELDNRARDLYKKLIDSANNIALNKADMDEAEKAVANFEKFYREARETFEKYEKMRAERELIYTNFNTGKLSTEGLQLLVTKLEEAIKTAKEDFLGKTEKDDWVGQFEINPESNAKYIKQPVQKTLFSFSADKGICNYNDYLVGKQPKEGFDKRGNCDGFVAVDLEITERKYSAIDRQLSSIIDLTTKEKGKRGFYYRIPANMMVTLWLGKTDKTPGINKGNMEMQIAQMGTIASLPSTTGGRMSKYTLEYYANSGAMKNIRVSSKAALESSTIQALGSAATSIKDAQPKPKDNRLSEAELKGKQLDNEKKQLEIEKLRRELPNP